MKQVRIVSLFVALLLLSNAARADTIYFKHRTKLVCKVVGETPAGLLVMLGNDSSASMIIDPATILRIDWDFESRLQALVASEAKTGDDFNAHYKLGVWAEERAHQDSDLTKRALGEYLGSVGKKGVPDEVLLRLGRMFEKENPPNVAEALKYFQLYFDKHPESTEAEKAVSRLRANLPKNPPPPLPTSTGKDGLETKRWKSETWSNKAKLSQLSDTSNAGSKLLGVEFLGGKDKAAVGLSSVRNLTKAKSLAFDVYNPTKQPVRVAIAIVTGNYEWFESTQHTLKASGWSYGITFDLTKKNWKSKATGWSHRTAPKNLANVRKILILILNGKSKGKLYFDEIRFEKP